MNKYIKFPLVLGCVALVSGALLATTYQLTKDTIAQGVIDRQTNAINDLFDEIESKELIEVPSEFASRGVSSIVEVKSNSKTYKCYTINYKDSADGNDVTVIIALDSDAKVHGVKFVTVDSYISNYYNNEKYLASVVTNDGFDAESGATFTANDLNAALKIARDCMAGRALEPIEELFDGNITSKATLILPSGVSNKINNVQRVSSSNKNYYVYDVSYNDAYGDEINALYALNADGSFYKIKVVSGDSYALSFDLVSDFDTVTGATQSKGELITHYNLIKSIHTDVVINESFSAPVVSKETLDKTGADSKIKNIYKVSSNSIYYYVYEVKYNDAYGDAIHVLYTLNANGSFYKIKVISGDTYALSFDLVSDLDTVTGATQSKGELKSHYNIVKACHDALMEGN